MTKRLSNERRLGVYADGERSVAIAGNVSDSIIITDDRGADLTLEKLTCLTEAYLQAVEGFWTCLVANDTRLPLDNIFFTLQAQECPKRRPLDPPLPDLPPDPSFRTATHAPQPELSEAPSTSPPPLPLDEVLKKESRLVILGEPGAGKSTVLQFVALCFARRQKGGLATWHAEWLEITHPHIPILLSLQTRANTIAASDSLSDVMVGEIRSFLPEASELEVRALLNHWLQHDGLLVLLDGLDEVTQDQSAVREKIIRYQGDRIRMVVASRSAGFTPLGDLKPYSLKPLDENEALVYLKVWLGALTGCSEQKSREQANQLHAQMSEQPALRRLMSNPLLLRLSAEYYARSGEVVRNRTDLYRVWVEEAWQRAVDKRGADSAQKEVALTALETLAWHRQVGGDNDEQSLCQALQVYGVANNNAEAESWLALLREKVGLLALDIERKEIKHIQYYLFAHQTVREYFVARRLQRAWEQHARYTLRFLKLRLHLPEWREPLLLLGGLLPEQEAQRLISGVWRANSPYERRLKRDLLLAAEIVASSGSPLPAHLLSALIAVLQHRYRSMREAASRALGKIGPQAVPSLIAVLGNEASLMRESAAEALGKIGDSQAVPDLCVALQDGDGPVAQAALRALGMIGNPQAVPTLIAALGSETSFMRESAAETLGVIGDPRAVPALLAALQQDEEWCVSQAAVQALGEIGGLHAVSDLITLLRDEYDSVRMAAQEALVKIGPAVVPALLVALQDEEWYVRRAAAEALGEIGDPHAVLALIAALQDKYGGMRESAAEALGKIGDSQAVPALIAALQGRSRSVREAASRALGRIGSFQAVPALIATLQDEEWCVRRAAAEALGEIGDPQAVSALITALQDEDWFVRWAVAETLGAIGAPQAVPALTTTLQDEDWNVSRVAAEALGEIGGPQAALALIVALQDEGGHMRGVAAKTLGKFGAPQVVLTLRAALQDEDGEVRQAAAEALGTIGDPKTVPDLIMALRDKNWDVYQAAAEALGAIGDPQAVPALLEVVRKEVWKAGQMAAAEAIEKISDPQSVPTLLAALGDKYWYVRRAATKALTKTLTTIPLEKAGDLLPYLPVLARRAARRKEYELLGVILQHQAAWRVMQSPWRDPLQPPPGWERWQKVQRVALGAAAALLAGLVAVLGVLLAGAQDVLKEAALPIFNNQDVVSVAISLFLLAVLGALLGWGIDTLRKKK